MKIVDKIEDLIGNTPLYELKNIEKQENLNCKILVKLEFFNPAGSVKDRAALYMLNDAEKRGKIKAGGVVIEPTSGNTGIGLAAIGASRGYKVILTMPDTMSEERIKLLKAYGAEVVLTKGELGMQGAIKKAEEIQKNTPNSFIAGQFSNPSNAKSHYETTAREIWKDTKGKFDAFIASIGSGGTLSGIGRFIKEKSKKIKVIGIEPASSPLINKGVSGSHKIQGIGANFIPENYDAKVVDSVYTVTDEEAYKYTKLMAVKEGLLVGISSGAALAVAIKYAKENNAKTVVTLLPDTGMRYLSVKDLF